MAWAIGFGFQEVQARPKPTPGQHFWLGLCGLAWLLAWGQAMHITTSKCRTYRSAQDLTALLLRKDGVDETIARAVTEILGGKEKINFCILFPRTA